MKNKTINYLADVAKLTFVSFFVSYLLYLTINYYPIQWENYKHAEAYYEKREKEMWQTCFLMMSTAAQYISNKEFQKEIENYKGK